MSVEKREKIMKAAAIIMITGVCALFASLIGLGIVLIVIGAAIFGPLFFIEKKETKRKRIEEFFKECKKNGISDLNSQVNRQKAELIAQKYEFKYDSIDQLFSETLEVHKQNEIAKQKAELDALVAEERRTLQELTRYSSLTGRDKRIQMLADRANEYLAKINGTVKGTDAIMRASQQKEHSWATHGGLAAGLGGPIAGAAVAMDIQAKNAKIRAENEARMNALTPLILASMDVESEYRERVKNLEASIKKAEVKLVADTPKEEVLSYLSIGVKNVNFSKTGAFAIDVEMSMVKEVKIFENLDAVVDGTVAAHLYQNDAYVGTALLVLPAFGVGTKVETVSGIALCPSRADLPYEVRFTAHNLWLMEKQ